MATVNDKRRDWALQGLDSPVSSAPKREERSPSWVQYLSGITKGVESGGTTTSPFPKAYPTQRRREFEEQRRQFNQQMALQRAEAARRAEEARMAKEAAAQGLTRQDMVNSVMALVDYEMALGSRLGRDVNQIWDNIETEMLMNYGRFPEEFDYTTARNIALDYFYRQTPSYEPRGIEDLLSQARQTESWHIPSGNNRDLGGFGSYTQ